MQTEQANGRPWNAYVCPGCRKVFRVVADFTGERVMCPLCQEVLQLPKTLADVPPLPDSDSQPPDAPAPLVVEACVHEDELQPVWRDVFTSREGRIKLALFIGLPVLVVAVVLMLLQTKREPVANSVPDEPGVYPLEMEKLPPVAEEPPDVARLDKEPAPPQVELVPEVIETNPPPESSPPAVPGEPEPAAFAEVRPEPVVIPPAPQVTPVVDPDEGLVEAVPVQTPAATGTPAPDLTPAPAPVVQAPVPPAPQDAPAAQVPRFHVVVRGDNLIRIARKYKVDPKEIMKLNGMKNDIVRLGAKLSIPPSDP